VTGLAFWRAEVGNLASGLQMRSSSRDNTRLQNYASSYKSVLTCVQPFKARDDQPSDTLLHSRRTDTDNQGSHAPVLNRPESMSVEKPLPSRVV
jgi:hypothetical protein